MSPECHDCGRKLRCPVAIPHSATACRIIKWLCASIFFALLGMLVVSAKAAVAHGLQEELGMMLLVRTSLLIALFMATMWAMNHVITCSARGGIPERMIRYEP